MRTRKPSTRVGNSHAVIRTRSHAPSQTPSVPELKSQSYDAIDLLECFAWDEPTFLARTEGSAIRRIGFQRWRRNVAIALGNATTTDAIKQGLRAALPDSSAVVQEHIEWALAQHE